MNVDLIFSVKSYWQQLSRDWKMLPVRRLFPESISPRVRSAGGVAWPVRGCSRWCAGASCCARWTIRARFPAGNAAGPSARPQWWQASDPAGRELLGGFWPWPPGGAVCGRWPGTGGETLRQDGDTSLGRREDSCTVWHLDKWCKKGATSAMKQTLTINISVCDTSAYFLPDPVPTHARPTASQKRRRIAKWQVHNGAEEPPGCNQIVLKHQIYFWWWVEEMLQCGLWALLSFWHRLSIYLEGAPRFFPRIPNPFP